MPPGPRVLRIAGFGGNAQYAIYLEKALPEGTQRTQRDAKDARILLKFLCVLCVFFAPFAFLKDFS